MKNARWFSLEARGERMLREKKKMKEY